MDERFQWNSQKATVNLAKHDVSFEEAASIFDDPVFITVLDEEHSTDEDRYITIGMSSQRRLLLVAHAERNGIVRIISARRATKHEREFYAEGS
jgi:uncharacterized DUF497 family protein